MPYEIFIPRVARNWVAQRAVFLVRLLQKHAPKRTIDWLEGRNIAQGLLESGSYASETG